jgi:hypothetical protein
MFDATEIREHLLLRLLAHRTGVEQDDVGLFRDVGLYQAIRVLEYVGHLVRVVLVHLASERPDVKLLAHEIASRCRAGGERE